MSVTVLTYGSLRAFGLVQIFIYALFPGLAIFGLLLLTLFYAYYT